MRSSRPSEEGVLMADVFVDQPPRIQRSIIHLPRSCIPEIGRRTRIQISTGEAQSTPQPQGTRCH